MTYVRHRYGGLYNSQLPHEERQWSASASTAVAPRFAVHCGAHCGSRQRTASMLDASKREALPPSCVAASVSTVDAVSEAEPAMESSTSFGPLPPWIPRAALDEPLPALQRLAVKPKFLHQPFWPHGTRQILLVCEYKQGLVVELLFRGYIVKSRLCVLDAIPVVAVYHKDQSIHALVVVAPQRPNLIPSSNVPCGERSDACFALVGHGLDIEANC